MRAADAYLKVHDYAPELAAAWKSHDVGTPLVEAVLIVVLLGMIAFVIVGMKSRACALLLALWLGGSACYLHPFWVYAFSTETYQPDELPAVVLPATAAGQEVDAQTMADHQRYFFFQAMSTVGALVLLVVHGPGNFSMDEQQGTTETLLKSMATAND